MFSWVTVIFAVEPLAAMWFLRMEKWEKIKWYIPFQIETVANEDARERERESKMKKMRYFPSLKEMRRDEESGGWCGTWWRSFRRVEELLETSPHDHQRERHKLMLKWRGHPQETKRRVTAENEEREYPNVNLFFRHLFLVRQPKDTRGASSSSTFIPSLDSERQLISILSPAFR